MNWLKFEIKLVDDQITNSNNNTKKAWNEKTHNYHKTNKSPITFNGCHVICHGWTATNSKLGSKI